MITITDEAARHLHDLLSEKGEDGQGLRIRVDKGGCAGLQYSMSIDSASDGDHVVENGDVKVIVDTETARLVEGSEVGYDDGLTSSGFKIRNPRAVRSCGCGTSFETDRS